MLKGYIDNKRQKLLTEEDVQKMQLIDELLFDEECFFKLDMETAIGILEFLEVPEEKMIGLYQTLISPEAYLEKGVKQRIILDDATVSSYERR